MERNATLSIMMKNGMIPDDMREWLHEHHGLQRDDCPEEGCSGWFANTDDFRFNGQSRVKFHFGSVQEAVLFKLTWGGRT